MMKKNYISPEVKTIDLLHELPVMQVGGSVSDKHEKEDPEVPTDVKEEYDWNQKGSSVWDEEW